MRYKYGLGSTVAAGEPCDIISNINCSPGYQCSPQGLCVVRGGNPADIIKDPGSYVCPYDMGSEKDKCDKFVQAIIADAPIVGAAFVAALGLFNYFALNVLPQATGVFDASIMSGIMFQPISDYIRGLIGQHDIQNDIDGTLDTAWKSALASVKLPDDISFGIPKEYLKPDASIIDSTITDDYWNGNANSPEEALLTYLYAVNNANNGWNKFYKYEFNSDDTHGYAYIQSSNDVGDILDPLTSLCSDEGGLCSHGPFGLTGGGWPERCNSSCMTQFAQTVSGIWTERFNTLQSALPTITSAIARQAVELSTQKEQQDQKNISKNIVKGKNLDSITNVFTSGTVDKDSTKKADSTSTGSSFWSLLLGLGLIGGAGTLVYYVGKEATKEQKYSKMGTLREPVSGYLPMLDEFIENVKTKKFPSNSYVIESGFRDLYVRYGSRYVYGERIDNVLDIPNVIVDRPGSGAFTRLIERLRKDYPGMSIYVENVFNIRFGPMLERLGFVKIGDREPYSYFMKA